MFGAIANLILLALMITVFIVWIISLVRWDGKCDLDCWSCPYDDGNCKLKEERKYDGD